MSLRWDGESAIDVTGSVFTTCTANLVFTDDNVRAVYIDWDDGTNPQGVRSNEKEYANYQWQQITKPTGNIDIEHTYTGTGTYAPVIQILNSDGIVSAYYGSDTTNTDVSPYYDNTTHQTFEALDGTALGIMNVENKTVLSGIDNSLFFKEGPKDIYFTVPPLLTSAQLTGTVGTIILEIEAVVAESIVSSSDITVQAGATRALRTLRVEHTITTTEKQVEIPIIGGRVLEVKKVTFMNPKYAGSASARTDNYRANNVYNYLKIFITTKGNDGLYYPVTYVSAGSPIKKADDARRYITMDFSQSRAKASNVLNSAYRYDVGKMWINPAYKWNAIIGSTAGDYEFFGDNTSGTTSNKQVSYAYNQIRPDGLDGQAFIGSAATGTSILFNNTAQGGWAMDGSATTAGDYIYRTNQCLINEFGTFQDQYHLVRDSMQPASATTNTGSQISSLVNNKPHIYRITPPSDADWTKVDKDPASATASYTQEVFQNTSGTRLLLSGMNDQDYQYFDGTNRWNTGVASTEKSFEYILMLWPKKTNKVFFNITNYAADLIKDYMWNGQSVDDGTWKIAGVDYLVMEGTGTRKTQNAFWQAVPFHDTTAVTLNHRYVSGSNETYKDTTVGLAKSGYVDFDMPLDWAKTNFNNLCGGIFNPTVVPTSPVAGDFDITITGTVATGAADSTYGKSITISSITTAAGNELSTLGTADDIGAFKYIAFVKTAAGAADTINRPIWVAGADGTNAAPDFIAGAEPTTLTMIYGENDASDYNIENLNGDSGVVFVIRRINAYDVLNGASMVESGSTDILTPPVDYLSGSSFPHTYMLSGNSTLLTSFGTDFSAAWKSDDYYPLRITVSGNVESTSGGHRFPEIFNVFDATESHVEIVKEIDDSAFNLNGVPITGDVSISRDGTYYQAITRGGKVYISRTGDSIQSIMFTSAALGTTNGNFADVYETDPAYPNGTVADNKGSMYWNLHQMRMLQAKTLRVYWDSQQKDGTWVRFFGVITSLQETTPRGGPKVPISFNFQMTVQEIALIGKDNELMTDLFPLGGIVTDKGYTSGGRLD
tara:strand:+ start:9282 stop:12452 length:3171 start_codon:yes stop_codon:yes gene_type:complete